MLTTAGLTYAEYAREGFGQLVVASALTLGVVAVAARFAERGTVRREVVPRLLLGGLCAATLAVLASALHRLGLDEEAFGYTRSRLVAHAFALWLGGIFILVLLAGLKGRAAWLVPATVALTTGSLLLLNFANPDGLVAAGNVERYERTGKVDTGYLRELSADAVPAILRLPARRAVCALPGPASDLRRPGGWSSANPGRWRARRALRTDSGAQVRAIASSRRAAGRGRTPRRSSARSACR